MITSACSGTSGPTRTGWGCVAIPDFTVGAASAATGLLFHRALIANEFAPTGGMTAMRVGAASAATGLFVHHALIANEFAPTGGVTAMRVGAASAATGLFVHRCVNRE